MKPENSDLAAGRVLEVLAAAQFATAVSLPLDVLVTLNFTAMGVTQAGEARTELQRFLKTMAAWLNERRLPVVWIAAIERGRGGNLHAHIAVHVPGVAKDGDRVVGIRYRTQFRKWAREAMARRVGAAVPRLVNIRCGLTQSEVAHWICVTYLLKGSDRTAVLSPSRASRDGEALPLADIMPFPYRSAGDVGGRRLFVSGNLGPARRKIGMPAGFEFMLPAKPDLLDLEIVPGANAGVPKRPRSYSPKPFVAAVEHGRFDVRDIYGEAFVRFVTETTTPTDVVDPTVITLEQLIEHLDHLGI